MTMFQQIVQILKVQRNCPIPAREISTREPKMWSSLKLEKKLVIPYQKHSEYVDNTMIKPERIFGKNRVGRKKYYDKRNKVSDEPTVREGDLVKILTTPSTKRRAKNSFTNRFDGPYFVIRRTSSSVDVLPLQPGKEIKKGVIVDSIARWSKS